MAAVLTEASTFSCGPLPDHGGSMSPTPADVLTIGGQRVVTFEVLAATAISGCKHQVQGAATPCTKLAPPSAGSSTTLRVGGKPVALASFAAQTLPNGATLAVTAHDDLASAS